MAEAARRLLARLRPPDAGGLLEAGGDDDGLSADRVRDSLDLTRAALAGAADRALLDRLLADASSGFARLAEAGPAAPVTPAETMALEAVIAVDGSRPVLFVQDGTIAFDAPEMRRWSAATLFRRQIERVVASVGRVETPRIEPGKAGTAFMLAPGLVVTARHVLEGLAEPDGGGGWRYHDDAWIEFAGEHQRTATHRFRLGEVLFCGPRAIDWTIDFARLDIAVVRLVDGAVPFPEPLSFARDVARYGPVAGRGPPHVYTVGFPGEPAAADGGEADGPPIGGTEYRHVIDELFRGSFGVKRWAPGEIVAAPGALDGDAEAWVFGHDASTLAGSSGGCVVDLRDDGERVLGLHFGGRARGINWAHAFAAIGNRLPAALGAVWL